MRVTSEAVSGYGRSSRRVKRRPGSAEDPEILSNLTSLTELGLEDNMISDISPLVDNSGLGSGDEIWLEDNNLKLSEGSEDMENIRILEERGVEVHY